MKNKYFYLICKLSLPLLTCYKYQRNFIYIFLQSMAIMGQALEKATV